MPQPSIRYNQPPPQIPEPGAVAYGQDEYGYWQAFDVAGVEQIFRWIHPGTFTMGSPADEPERYDDETEHEVTLSQGFWLADTACTQALWQAVMASNPSYFNNKQLSENSSGKSVDSSQHPVEQVSWEDCQAFIAKLNQLAPHWQVRLPLEAEWEYACRAGTTTPFSFGKNITTDQVNYDGNYPYNGAEKGEDRDQTIPVKELPATPWGLYQMNGNVWEWCQDWFLEDLGRQPQQDPPGPAEGSSRVLRGGSWDDYARDCRSAYRGRDSPGFRNDLIGLRLARGIL